MRITTPGPHFGLLRRQCYVTRFGVWVCLFAVSAAGGDTGLAKVLQGVEDRYNHAQTLDVRFQQTYAVPQRGPHVETGELFLRKPGRMRWQYANPAGKLFVSDGKYLYLYTPAGNRVERSKARASEDMRAPLAFLLGKLDFQKDFTNFLMRRNGAEISITAEPRSDRLPYTQVEFMIGPAFEIRELRVTGQDSSIMEFRFEDERLNPRLADKLFEFQPPKGAEIVEAAS